MVSQAEGYKLQMGSHAMPSSRFGEPMQTPGNPHMVHLNHRPRPYQSSAIRSYNNLQEPRGLPKYAEIAQNIVVCGLDCGLKKSTNFVATMPFPRDAFLRKDHSEVAVWKTATESPRSQR
jgi:hypothetical protein